MPKKKEVPINIADEQIPPQNIEAEQSVLGGILIDPKIMLEVSDILEPEDFYKPAHKIIFEAMMELDKNRQAVDLITLSGRLKEKNQLDEIGGLSYLTELANIVPTSSHVMHYANLVHKKRVLRDLIAASYEIRALGWDEERDIENVLDEAEQKLFRVSQKTGIPTLRHIGSADLKEADKRIEMLHRGERAPRGVPTNFPSLDNLLSGLQRSNLIVLAARPSLGKTALALDIARKVAVEEHLPVAIFSLEMSRPEVVDRLIAAQAPTNLWEMRTGNISEKKDKTVFERIRAAINTLEVAPIFIDDSPSPTVLQIRTMARRMQAEHGLALVIVDYLQLIMPSRLYDSPVQQTTEISHRLKDLARELDIPVIAISQLSRAVENRGPKSVPQLSDLRESGSIEQDADVVMFIHRPNRDMENPNKPEIVEIHLAKHRNGPIGKRKLLFVPSSASFEEVPKEYFMEEETLFQDTAIEVEA